ncbi:MAG: FAD:protein FMN transferase [Rhodobacteraceae bacterium]|nr:FAD:protein FMN transferase [Paracoccaceae bacterium]
MSIEVSSLSGPTMGTRFAARFLAPPGARTDGLQQALQAAVDRVDQQMSPWIETSAVNQINRANIGDWIAVPPQTREVLAAAVEIEKQSGGAFRINVGDHVKHWGFGPDPENTQKPPFDTRPAQACFHSETTRIRKLNSTQIDLCGIAKGYGVDQLAIVMQDRGINDYLVSIDGELRCAGSPGSGAGWSVGLEAPLVGKRRVEHILDCHDLALATSGGYRHYKTMQERTVTHTISPFSSKPLSEIEVSVTVAHQNCCMADGWATAFLVMGLEMALKIADRLGMHVLFMDHRERRTVAMGTGIFTGLSHL